mgnify:FL=1
MAELLRGAPVATAITESCAERVRALESMGVSPTLAVVRVGERADDLSYERGLLKRAERAGVAVRRVVLPADCSQAELMGKVARLNADASVHGCLVFRPLPSQLDEDAVAAALAPEKDVDCLTPSSLAHVLSGSGAGFAPCTAEAVVRVLEHYGVPLAGADVTVVGRSLVIGRPVALMLQRLDATVTMCHSKTGDLARHCREADVLVVAVGHARAIGADALHAGQVVVDVGINWDAAAGRLVGDVDAEAALAVAGACTPVPGGVGSVTTAVLMDHVVTAAERAAHIREGENHG